MSRKLLYQEGTWFLVPLRPFGFAVGLVARAEPKGKVLFGYFFGPKLEEAPSLSSLSRLKPQNAISRMKFGDLNLLNGKWRILGSVERLDRQAWPFPVFCRKDVFTGQIYLVRYDEDNPSKLISEERIQDFPSDYCEDGLSGAGAVEGFLSKLLQQKSLSA